MRCRSLTLRVIVVSLGLSLIAGTAVRADSPDSVFADNLSRWVEIQTFLASVRFRFLEPDPPAQKIDQMQAREQLTVRLHADPRGYVAVTVGAMTGPTFTGSWNDTGIGSGHERLHASLRYLSLDVTPVKGVIAQIGSLPLVRGETTEITSFDNDGYMVGERLSLRRPKLLFFDEVTVSRGFVGDANLPSVFDRHDRLADFNYQQYLVSRRVHPRVFASFDYTRYAHANIVHIGTRVRTPELRVADLLRYEQYLRYHDGRDEGFSVSGEKQIAKTIALSLGYADIDRSFGGLNADRFNRGRRWFGTASYAISPVLSVLGFVQHAVHNDYALPNRTRIDVVLQYNVLAHLQQAGLWK